MLYYVDILFKIVINLNTKNIKPIHTQNNYVWITVKGYCITKQPALLLYTEMFKCISFISIIPH